jgi:hypothetical protein
MLRVAVHGSGGGGSGGGGGGSCRGPLKSYAVWIIRYSDVCVRAAPTCLLRPYVRRHISSTVRTAISRKSGSLAQAPALCRMWSIGYRYNKGMDKEEKTHQFIQVETGDKHQPHTSGKLLSGGPTPVDRLLLLPSLLLRHLRHKLGFLQYACRRNTYTLTAILGPFRCRLCFHRFGSAGRFV